MMVCERCGSGFHSTRAAQLEFCPRCLLRDDASARLLPKPTEPRDDEAEPTATDR